jgi:hypothetical protein
MPASGFPMLFYWAYWAEHALVWGDPRFGLAVYPVLVAIALPKRADIAGRDAVSGRAERSSEAPGRA